MEASKTCGVPRLFPELLWQRPTSAGTLGVGVQRSISSKPEVKPQVDLLENKAVAPEFTNLNGWTLKLLAEARKARDWETVWPPREFWCRFRVKRTQYHIEALVDHRNDQVAVSASVSEWAIQKHPYCTKNVVVCERIGLLLAERC